MNLQSSSFFSKAKTLARLVLGIPLALVSFYFLSTILLQNKEQTIPMFTESNKGALLLGIIFFLLYFYTRGYIWKRMLAQRGYHIDTGSSMFLYQWAEMKRYVPGNIFSFLARTLHFSQNKVPKNVTLKLIFFEALLLTASAAIASIPYGYFATGIPYGYILLTMISFGFLLRRYIVLYYDILFFFLLSWFFFGVGHFFIAVSVSPLHPFFFLQTISFFVLAWLVGYLSFVTPMGLGVREAVIVLGLSTMYPLFVASAISVLSRVVLMLTELIFLAFSFVWHRLEVIKKVLRKAEENSHLFILFGLIFVYIAYFTYVSFERHTNFFTGRFDLGNMDQTVWNTTQGRVFTLTNPDGTGIISRLAIHADFILVLLSPFHFIWQSPLLLLLIQSIVLGMGALFVYLLSVHGLRSRTLSLTFAISFLFNPFLQRQNLYDFHPVTLATTFLLAAFYFVTKQRFFLFFIFLFLAALTKENIYLICVMFGLYLMVSKKKVLLGSILSAVSLTIFLLLVLQFIPAARGGNHFVFSYFQEFGESPVQIGKNILFQPTKTFFTLFTLENLSYLKNLFAGAGFLSFLSPFYLLFSIFDVAVNLLSSNDNLKSIQFHYGASILPFIYISAIFGVRRLLSFAFFSKRANMVTAYLFLSSLISAWGLGPLPGALFPSFEVFTQKIQYREEITKHLNTIPPTASVSATNNLGAHLSQRERIYTVPNGIQEADFVAFLLTDPYSLPPLEEQRRLVEELKRNKKYMVVFEKESFVLFKKIPRTFTKLSPSL